jgi:VanZ family protein
MATLKHRLNHLLQLRWVWRTALFISVLVTLFLATTDASYPIPSSPNDKVNHLIAFLELTILTRLSWPTVKSWHYAPLLLAFGLTIEAIQATLPYRYFSLADLAADGAGIMIGMLPWPGLSKPGKTKVRNSPNPL